MFRIVRETIVGPLIESDVADGGLVVFEGRVRVTNDGQTVEALEYEAYDELAVAEGERILREALSRFPIRAVACVHRVGKLALGEVAIRVEVTAGHRREAFEACEFVVDETKRRVPIWKKEHYASGATDWLHADGRKAVTPSALYDRQLRVPEIGQAGQAKLGHARVLVVGAGGLGSPALTYLAAAGVGRLTILEPDRVEPSNLHRQPLYGWSDVGAAKARLAAERLRKLNPFVEVEAVSERLTPQNAERWIEDHDLVIDGTDNFKTKFLLNDACVRAGKPLVMASVHRWEGQIAVLAPEGPCLRCLWPEPPPDGCVGTCADDGVVGVVPGILGSLQALEAIKWILGVASPSGDWVLVDLRNLETQRIGIPRRPDCPTCGQPSDEATASHLMNSPETPYEVFPGSPLEGYLIVDIRESHEVESEPLPLPEVLTMPMSMFDLDAPELAEAERILLVCHAGVRSDHLAVALRQNGDGRYFTLVGGLLGLQRRF